MVLSEVKVARELDFFPSMLQIVSWSSAQMKDHELTSVSFHSRSTEELVSLTFCFADNWVYPPSGTYFNDEPDNTIPINEPISVFKLWTTNEGHLTSITLNSYTYKDTTNQNLTEHTLLIAPDERIFAV